MSLSLTAIDTQINALLSDLSGAVDYSVGDKRVSNSQKLKQLLALRKNLSEVPEVDLDFVQFDTDIDQIGTDDSQTTVL